jgi:hypothetical protein
VTIAPDSNYDSPHVCMPQSHCPSQGVGTVEDSAGVTGPESAFGTVRWSEWQRKDGAGWLTHSTDACNKAECNARNSNDGSAVTALSTVVLGITHSQKNAATMSSVPTSYNRTPSKFIS